MARCLQTKQYEIVCLAIFHITDKQFKAHPIQWQRAQARALGLPLCMYCVDPVDNCYKKGYARAIRQLKDEHEIDTIITGDIDYVGNSKTNFMSEVCETFVPDVTIHLPLWQEDRTGILQEMISQQQHDFHIIFSCVKEPLNATWIGRRLDQKAVEDLQRLDIDLTGENGEYHTMVLHAPNLYKTPLKLVDLDSLELKDQLGQKNERWWVCSYATKLIWNSETE